MRATKNRKQILLIEDDDNHAEIFAFHAVAHCPAIQIERMIDGEAVIRYLEENRSPGPDYPELIILDLNLPRFSGLEVLAALKAHPVANRIPTVILTSSTSEKDIEKAWAIGANSYLRKPLASSEFKPLIQLVLDYWMANQTDQTVYSP